MSSIASSSVISAPQARPVVCRLPEFIHQSPTHVFPSSILLGEAGQEITSAISSSLQVPLLQRWHPLPPSPQERLSPPNRSTLPNLLKHPPIPSLFRNLPLLTSESELHRSHVCTSISPQALFQIPKEDDSIIRYGRPTGWEEEDS